MQKPTVTLLLVITDSSVIVQVKLLGHVRESKLAQETLKVEIFGRVGPTAVLALGQVLNLLRISSILSACCSFRPFVRSHDWEFCRGQQMAFAIILPEAGGEINAHKSL